MSKINELIQQLCPKGVEFKQMWEVTSWDKKFNSVDKVKQPKVFKFKYYLASELKPLIIENGDVKILTTNNTNIFTSKELINNEYYNAEIIAIPWGGNPIVQYFNGDFITSDNRIAISNDTNILATKFLYYYLLDNLKILASFYRGAGIKHPNMAKVLDLYIPIPPIQVQEEIVKILDQFTALEQELNNELQARKQQYNFFLNQLLRFEEDNVEWKNLGDLYDFKNGLNKGKEFFGKGTPIINFTDVFKNIYLTKERLNGLVEVNDTEKIRYKAQKNDLFFTRTSEVKDEIGMSCVLVDDVEDCVFSGFVLRARPKTELHISKFIAYYLRTYDVRTQIIRYSSFTTRGLTSGPKLSKIKIPVPSLEEQERIVKILDQFDTLVNDTTVGLPAEINARKQQYEYYRNQLLTFKPLD